MKYIWHSFYKELANALLQYKNKREDLVSLIERIYSLSNISMPTFEEDNVLEDIDPFTIFGIFNKASQTPENRIKLANAIKEIFDLTTPVPTIYDGVPTLNNQNSTYYNFKSGRGEHDIDILWDLLEKALAYDVHPTEELKKEISSLLDQSIQIKHNAVGKISMALFWVAPETFLNLDSRNQWYIYTSKKLPNEVVRTLPKFYTKLSGKAYFDIREKILKYLESGQTDLKSFSDLSNEAFNYSQEVNERMKSSPTVGDSVQRVWLYSPGEKGKYWDEFSKEGIMAIGFDKTGDLKRLGNRSEVFEEVKDKYPDEASSRNQNMVWQFFKVIKPGDIVYAKQGRDKILGKGVVESDYSFDNSRPHFYHSRKVKWTQNGLWENPSEKKLPIQTLIDITNNTELVDKLNELFENEVIDPTSDPDIPTIDKNKLRYPKYTVQDFQSELYLEENDFDILSDLLRTKKNLILQGPPGTGKTFAAKRLAWSMMGEKDPSRIATVQFHQGYSYEDFFMGYRPTKNGYELREGPFYTFCQKAREDEENEYFFIIDEINRGNISRVFGELLSLIESDHRGENIGLMYRNEQFSVPENVYVIAMMNTADRSIALLDHALRRRFSFFDMKPGFNSAGFIAYQKELNSSQFNRLIEIVKELNEEISGDDLLGEGYQIGHSFFCSLQNANDQDLNRIVNYELIPLLKEYWFDDQAKVKAWGERLKEAIA